MTKQTFCSFLHELNKHNVYRRNECVIGADVDVGTNATTWVLLMDSDLKSVYAVLFSCTYPVICDNCSEPPNPGL